MAGILTEKESILLMGQLILDTKDGIISQENTLNNLLEEINVYVALGCMNTEAAQKLKQMVDSERDSAETIYNQIKEDLA